MLKDRIRNKELLKKVTTAERAAELVKDGMIIGTASSVFSSGPRVFFKALAERGKKGELKDVTMLSLSLLCREIDGALVEAGILKRRLGSITDDLIRKAINAGTVLGNDVRTEMVSHLIRSECCGKMDVAVVEAIGITEEGHIIPTNMLLEAANQVQKADIVIVEINTTLPKELEGIHDVYVMKRPPEQGPLCLHKLSDRIGTTYIPAGVDKISCIIESNLPHQSYPAAFQAVGPGGEKMAGFFLDFMREEVKKGRMPKNLLPIASGIGQASDGILRALAKSEFEDLEIFSPIVGDGVVGLIDAGKCRMVNGPVVFLSDEAGAKFREHIEEYKKKIIIRSIDVTHDPGIVRQIGGIALNNALEIDIYGHINSSHIGGTRLVNGVGGGGVYAINAYLSVFCIQSTGKKGDISSFVPMVTHVDHPEHFVDVIVTEQGLADIRCLSPVERARIIINNCAHPDYRPMLTDYLERAIKTVGGHEPQMLDEVFSWHKRLKETGSMKQK